MVTSTPWFSALPDLAAAISLHTLRARQSMQEPHESSCGQVKALGLNSKRGTEVIDAVTAGTC